MGRGVIPFFPQETARLLLNCLGNQTITKTGTGNLFAANDKLLSDCECCHLSKYQKKKRKRKHPIRNTLLVLFLLVLCVGGAELVACRFADPELYKRVTTPVVEAAADVRMAAAEKYDSARTWATEQKQAWEDRKNAREAQEQIESQSAGDPLLPSVDGDIDPTDPTITRLIQRHGQETLTGGSVEVAYFAQSDDNWKDLPFGTDTIGAYGCGPTTMAMAVRSLTGLETDPGQIAAWAADNGYWAPQSGSYHSLVAGVASACGLKCEPMKKLTVDDLQTHLSGGEIGVALMKAGHFTSAGHFILLRGVTLSGNILVADPNSRSRSLQAWNAQLILDELSTARDNGAPLWLLSNTE